MDSINYYYYRLKWSHLLFSLLKTTYKLKTISIAFIETVSLCSVYNNSLIILQLKGYIAQKNKLGETHK